MRGTVYNIRVHSETLPSLARAIDLLGRLHDMFDVNCEQQMDDLREILEGAQEQAANPGILTPAAVRERGVNPESHSVHWTRTPR